MTPHQGHFLRLAQYNTWLNGQLYGLLDTLDDTERKRDRGAFFGSIHATLDHLLLGDRMWLGRFQKSPLPFPSLETADLIYQIEDLGQGVCPDYEDLRREHKRTDAVLEAFVRDLTPKLIDEELAYTNSRGIDFSHPVWHVVAHIFNHQTHHRGQVTTLLSQQGLDPGMMDLIVTALMPLET